MAYYWLFLIVKCNDSIKNEYIYRFQFLAIEDFMQVRIKVLNSNTTVYIHIIIIVAHGCTFSFPLCKILC